MPRDPVNVNRRLSTPRDPVNVLRRLSTFFQNTTKNSEILRTGSTEINIGKESSWNELCKQLKDKKSDDQILG
jgi:hypothetical protein